MIFSLDALVLSKEKLGEIDLLVELFTPKGKIFCVAKGAQKSYKRFVNLLEEFNFIKAYLRKTSKGKFPILEKADLIFLPEKVREDYKKYILLSFIGEVLSKISFVGLKIEYFLFIKSLIKAVDANKLLTLWKPFFELKILKFCGWTPELYKCIKCGYFIRKMFYFSVEEGGVVCYKCRTIKSEYLEIKVIEILRDLIRMSNEFERLYKIEKELEKRLLIKEKVFKISEKFFKFFLSFELNSLKFLNECSLGG